MEQESNSKRAKLRQLMMDNAAGAACMVDGPGTDPG